MATKPFEPKGEVARWVPVYERLKTMVFGEIITYAELSELAGVDIQVDRSPLRQAAKKLLELDQRGTVNVEGEGYRIAHPTEHSELARHQAKKARNRISAAIGLLSHADANYLTPKQREFNERVVGALSAQQDMMKRLTRRQDRVEEALKTVRRETKETTADLAERLARLESSLLSNTETQADKT